MQAEGGCRPASRPPFLASPRIAGQRKGGKEGAPCCPRPFRYAAGQPAPSTSWGCAAKLTARRRRFVQTAAASQCTKQLHSTVQLPAPSTCRRRRGHKGRYRMRVQDSFFIKLIAVTHCCALTKAHFVKILAGRPYPHPPVCPRLRHAVRAASNAAVGQRCFVI